MNEPSNGFTHPSVIVAGAIVASCLAIASPTDAIPTVTLTMDQYPSQTLGVFAHPEGVLFEFTEAGQPSFGAEYNDSGPGQLTFVDDPSIEGTAAGVLAATFDTPTPVVEFGVAVSVQDETIPDGAQVTLIDDAGGIVNVTSLSLAPFVSFAEAQFTYAGSPIKSIQLSFAPELLSERFAFDNLTFAIPEPASVVIALAAAATARSRTGRPRHPRPVQ